MMLQPLWSVALLSVLAAPPQTQPSSSAGSTPTTVFADVVYTAAGEPLRGGSVTFSGGKILAIAPGAPPADGLRVSAITPGMIDLSARIAGMYTVEQEKEVQPGLRLADALDLFDPAWKRHLESGVTTVLASPPDWNVVGGIAVALKTGGPPSVRERALEIEAALRGSMGTQPSSGNSPAFGRPRDFFARRPTTRMGVEWEWRKACYDALAAQKDPARAFDGSEVLLRVLDGKLPVIVQAWATQDIRTAIFLKEEMAAQGKPGMRLILDAAAEAWREPELLVRSGASVVLPPFPAGGRTNDGAFMAWCVGRKLRDLGVPLALSSHGARSDATLDVQAAYARRGGLSLEEALEAVTIAPARMIGIQDRVGSIEVGKHADLVLWSGEPFELSSRVVGVILNGEWALDPRASAKASQ